MTPKESLTRLEVMENTIRHRPGLRERVDLITADEFRLFVEAIHEIKAVLEKEGII